MAEPVYTVASDSETSVDDKTSPAFPETTIGIDIGTSQCSVAIWNGSEVEILKNIRDQKMMESFVSFKDERPTGGVNTQLFLEDEMQSGAAVFNVKRLIGRVDTDPVVHASKSLPFLVQTLGIGVRPFIAVLVKNSWRSTTPEEVLAIFLVELRAMAEAKLKHNVRNVVLSVPVSFSRFQLTRIARACAMAGLHVLRFMPEPTAVALLYAQQQLKTTPDRAGGGSEKIALIFNFGAGYCDMAVTATSGGVSHIKALSGGAIGGEDLLQNTMRYLFPNYDNLFSSPGIDEIRAMALLRVATQRAIHKLSSEPSVQVSVDLGNGICVSKLLERHEFEDVNQKVFGKCESLIVKCLRDAKVEAEELSDVILVGGCSCIPKVRDLVKRVCQVGEFYKEINALEAVACGVALEGAVASGASDPFGNLELLTIQATPSSVGIRADGNSFVPIIPQNITTPVSRDLDFTTIRDNQTEALIAVYEGVESKLEENQLLGYFKAAGIPPAPRGVPEIKVCVSIDAANALTVLAGVAIPGDGRLAAPFMEVRMPTVDDGHGWSAEALNKTYGSTLDLVTVQRKRQP